jgi:hypothetical protein
VMRSRSSATATCAPNAIDHGAGLFRGRGVVRADTRPFADMTHVRSVRRFFFDVLQPGEIETLIAIYDRVLDRVRNEGHNRCLEDDSAP